MQEFYMFFPCKIGRYCSDFEKNSKKNTTAYSITKETTDIEKKTM